MRKPRGHRAWRPACPHEPDILVDSEAWSAWAYADEVVCPWGRCVESRCVECGILTGNGMGAMACPCDTLPSWTAKHPAARHLPAVPVKARGRHGGRVARSHRIHGAAEDFYRRMNTALA